ncbi:hypothetical protein F4809DRAFT_660376 [Biscogniauxia mediterranea]|nr:hypothetical protein F4809DRAFT_660376 [Biscogniauxia mediterranea]
MPTTQTFRRLLTQARLRGTRDHQLSLLDWVITSINPQEPVIEIQKIPILIDFPSSSSSVALTSRIESPEYSESFVIGAEKGAMDVMAETTITPTLLPRNSGLGANFSYPRSDRPSRHESSESRSSVTSTGSLPGMTDASDSEASFEDDCNYNTSASELWDSFWPDSTPESEQQYPAFLQASRSRDYFNVHPPGHQSHDAEDDTIKITQLEHDPKITSRSYGGARDQPSSAPRSDTRRAPVSYSVYPRLFRTDIRRVELPPRTSSLNPELSTQPVRKPFLRAAKSSAALKHSKSSHNLHPLDFTPPNSATTEPLPSSPPPYLLARPTTSSSSSSSNPKAAAHSVPVSPAYPPPPVPKTLRPSTSAFALRKKQPQQNPRRQHLAPPLPISHNATAPLARPLKPPTAPMLRTQALYHLPPPSAPPTGPLPDPPQQHQQRFVSVFEFDSSDDDDDNNSDADEGRGGAGSRRRGSDGETASRLAKRIARGLGHKKSASEKQRARAQQQLTPVLGGGEFEKKHDNDEEGNAGNSNSSTGAGDKRHQGSLSRKRGGSLGRIFGGFMSR